MRTVLYVLILASTLHCFTTAAAQTASARFWCLSLRFDSTEAFLYFSTALGGVNGELVPSGGSYHTRFTMTPLISPIRNTPLTGGLQLDLPAFADVNGNGLDDFFESALPVSGMSSGSYSVSGTESGTVTATWQRAAGSPDGTCALQFLDSVYGNLGTFSLKFTILEYSGTVHYTPGTNTVTGNVDLVQIGYPLNVVEGGFQFVKNPTNRFDLLTLQSGSWTNGSTQMLPYTDLPYSSSGFSRGALWTTNYYGLLQLAIPGPPQPGQPSGYYYWALSIDDANDSDHNGVPDFSDDPTVAPSQQPPSLALTLTADNLLLSVSGEIGSAVDLQQAPSLPATNWQTIATLHLTNNAQTLSFSNSGAPVGFWRALVH